MKTFDLYVSSKEKIRVVKQGFSWPALFFGFGWAAIKGHSLLALSLFIGPPVVLGLVIGLLADSEGIFSVLIYNVIFWGAFIYLGLNGNDIVRHGLIKKGYAYIKSIDCESFPNFTDQERESLIKEHKNIVADKSTEGKPNSSKPNNPIAESKLLSEQGHVKASKITKTSEGAYKFKWWHLIVAATVFGVLFEVLPHMQRSNSIYHSPEEIEDLKTIVLADPNNHDLKQPKTQKSTSMKVDKNDHSSSHVMSHPSPQRGNGQGVAQDYKEAVKRYRKAAEQGDANAQFNLGLMYAQGQGVTQNYKEAVKWYTKAAEQGVAAAQSNLGVMYDQGQGVTQNYREAVKRYRKAAEQGVAAAQYNLGVRYDQGQGVTQNYKEAVKWYTKAANQGFAFAQAKLGFMYDQGRGVTQNYKEAVKWYTKAANQGFANAQSDLGGMYGNGQGVVQDYVMAHMWWNLAASNGNAIAIKNRNIVEKRMTIAQIAEAQRLAREWKPQK